MIKLFISTFGESIDWIKFNGVIPIEVGAKCRSKDTIHYKLTDDTMDSISELNPYYGELTGLYWIWKNFAFSGEEIIGFAHYNKILDIKSKKVKQFLNSNNNAWIVRDPVKMVRHDYKSDIGVIEEVLKKRYPDYYSSWEELYDSSGASRSKNCVNCEMFFTTVDEFNNYCKFLFGVLTEVQHIIGDVDRIPYHKRYCAFLGERLLSVYLKRNQRLQYNVLIRDRTNIVVDFLRRMARLLRLDRNSKLVIVVRKMVKKSKRKSSYLSI